MAAKNQKTWTISRDAESERVMSQIADRHPMVSRHKLLRLGLRFGLDAINKDPDLLYEEARKPFLKECP